LARVDPKFCRVCSNIDWAVSTSSLSAYPSYAGPFTARVDILRYLIALLKPLPGTRTDRISNPLVPLTPEDHRCPDPSDGCWSKCKFVWWSYIRQNAIQIDLTSLNSFVSQFIEWSPDINTTKNSEWLPISLRSQKPLGGVDRSHTDLNPCETSDSEFPSLILLEGITVLLLVKDLLLWTQTLSTSCLSKF